MATTNKRFVLASRPTGEPTPQNFRLEEVPLPTLQDGEVLVRHHYLSLDPYMRGRMNEGKSYAQPQALDAVMVGGTVGEVVESRHAGYKAGDKVVGYGGWQQYSVVPAGQPGVLRKVDTARVPLSAYLGAVGMPGVTAWVGLHKIIEAKTGETVVVSAASGAVGGVVGQLAKAAGCRAVGIAGGAAKCALVREAYGFDDCVDYKSPDFAAALARAVSEGVDVYFDNVGGPILDAVLPLLNNFSRIPVCGLVSQYNATEPYGVKNLREIFNRRVTMRGFVLSDHKALWPEATRALAEAYAAGRLHYRETIAEGLENAPQAFIDMLAGGNVGKQLVRLRPA